MRTSDLPAAVIAGTLMLSTNLFAGLFGGARTAGAQEPQHPHPDAHAAPSHAHGASDHTTPNPSTTAEHGMHHDFSNVAQYESQFESSERISWQKPDAVLVLMGVGPGMTVADIGAGTGFFLPYLAQAVGSSGHVLALDVESKMVEHMQQRVAGEKLTQVVPRQVPYDDPQLSDSSVDRILIVNTWHHIDDRSVYAAKLLRALRPGGKLYVIDFELSSPHGPPAQHRLSAERVIAELEAGGMDASQMEETLEYQYIVVAKAGS